jgi:hypothetical protein
VPKGLRQRQTLVLMDRDFICKSQRELGTGTCHSFVFKLASGRKNRYHPQLAMWKVWPVILIKIDQDNRGYRRRRILPVVPHNVMNSTYRTVYGPISVYGLVVSIALAPVQTYSSRRRLSALSSVAFPAFRPL